MAARFNVISYGENHYRVEAKCSSEGSVHAEHHAVMRLPPSHKKVGHMKKLDLLVIRVNRGGSLCSSKPCLHCVTMLSQLLPLKGYRVRNIYYSTEDGDIASASLVSLLRDEFPHVSKYHRCYGCKKQNAP